MKRTAFYCILLFSLAGAGLFLFFPPGTENAKRDEKTIETLQEKTKHKTPGKAPAFSRKNTRHREAEKSPGTAGAIGGHVFLRDGKPAWRAYVYCTLSPDEILQRTRTNSKGAFRFNGLNEKLCYTIEADLPGCAPETINFVETGTAGLRIVLSPGSRLKGDILTSDVGMPLDTFTVLLEGPVRRTVSFTEADGSFQVEGLPKGRYKVVVKASGYLDTEKTVTLKQGEEQSIQFLVPSE